jgi:hypothetical protein
MTHIFFIASGSGRTFGRASQTIEGELGSFYVSFKIESELSTSIDFDEIKIGEKIAEGISYL